MRRNSCVAFKRFEAADFPHPTNITGKWFPLVPGRNSSTRERSSRTGPRCRIRVVFTVTDLIKVIDGVPARVIWDVDYDDDQVAEAELAFFAQDVGDNVWTLGEYPESTTTEVHAEPASTWIQGEAHARPACCSGHPVVVLLGYSPRVHTLSPTSCAKKASSASATWSSS